MDGIFLKKDFELIPFLGKRNLCQTSRVFQTLHDINKLGQRK